MRLWSSADTFERRRGQLLSDTRFSVANVDDRAIHQQQTRHRDRLWRNRRRHFGRFDFGGRAGSTTGVRSSRRMSIDTPTCAKQEERGDEPLAGWGKAGDERESPP